MKKLSKGVSLVLMASVLICTPLTAEAKCTNWTYKTTLKCMNPHCGPGSVLYHQYKVGSRYRYCDVNGKQRRETQPYTSKVGKCCSQYKN